MYFQDCFAKLSNVHMLLHYKIRINLQLTGNISLELDSNSSLFLEYGR